MTVDIKRPKIEGTRRSHIKRHELNEIVDKLPNELREIAFPELIDKREYSNYRPYDVYIDDEY